MKSRTRAGSPTMLLLELVISILVFSLASAICVQIFVRSHNLSLEARDMSTAVTAVSSAAELVEKADSETELLELFEKVYPAATAEMSEDGLKMTAILEENGLVLTVTACSEDYMLNSDVSVFKGDSEIYSQQILHHVRRGNENG